MMRWLDRGLLTLAPIIKTHVDTFTYSLSNSRPKQFHFPPAHPRLALYLQKDLHHQPLKLKTEVWQSLWWWFHVHQQPHHLPCGSGSLPVMCAINANRGSHMPGKTWWWWAIPFQKVIPCGMLRCRSSMGSWAEPGLQRSYSQSNKHRLRIVTTQKWTVNATSFKKICMGNLSGD